MNRPAKWHVNKLQSRHGRPWQAMKRFNDGFPVLKSTRTFRTWGEAMHWALADSRRPR